MNEVGELWVTGQNFPQIKHNFNPKNSQTFDDTASLRKEDTETSLTHM